MMVFMGLVAVFVLGWCWRGYNLGYQKKQLEKALVFCDTMKDMNSILTKKIERLNKLGVREDESSLVCQMDRGILKAIADMHADLTVH